MENPGYAVLGASLKQNPVQPALSNLVDALEIVAGDLNLATQEAGKRLERLATPPSMFRPAASGFDTPAPEPDDSLIGRLHRVLAELHAVHRAVNTHVSDLADLL